MSLSSEICGQLYELAKNENGRNVELTLNEVSVLLIQNREDADYVLRRNVGNYRKNMSWFRKVLGASRFSEDGKEWEARRDLTQPYLNKFDRQQTFALSATYARQALAKMIAHSQAGAQTIDDRVLREMTASVLVENFFGIRFSETGVDLGLLAELIEFGSEYAFVPAGKTKDLYQDRLAALPELRRRVLANLSIFRSGKLPANPMLEGMLAADADPSSSFVFEHELITFLAAGAESSAATMSWVCHVLATNLALQEKLRREAQAFWASGDANWARLSGMPSFSALIDETLRIFPPTPLIARLSNGADQIGTHAILQDQNVLISFVGIQNDTQLRANPWVVDLEKGIEKGGDKGGDKGGETAFGFGPRICGGKQFALVELMSFLSVFLAQARFESTSSAEPVFHWKAQMLRQGGQAVRVTALA